MKSKIQYTLVILAIFSSSLAYAQTDSTDVAKENENLQEETVIEGKNLKIILKEKQIVTKTSDGRDTITNKVESLEIVTKGRDERIEDNDEAMEAKEVVKEPDFIETSWSNFHLGLNNLLNTDGKLEPDAGYNSMAISPANSINLQWNIVTQAMNLYKGKVRLVYGVGIDYNNYRFEKSVQLTPQSTPLALTLSDTDFKKNKLVTQHLTVPVLLNFKFAPKQDDDYVYISAGANFGYLIGSHQKQVWDDSGKKKIKNRDDFNLEQFRMGYEVQFGYKNIVLFGKYFPNSMFKENKGPDLRTVSAGILIGKV